MVYSGLWRWSIFRTTKRGRAAEYGYYKQVAAAADYLGYTGVLLQLVKDVKTLGVSFSSCC